MTGSLSTTLKFPIARGRRYQLRRVCSVPDPKRYRASPGTDYTAAMGSLVIPAGTTSTTIPVTVRRPHHQSAGQNLPDAIARRRRCGAQLHAALRRPAGLRQGSCPVSVTATDVNGDGRPDLIVVNGTARSVSVLLNTTAPWAVTPASPPNGPSAWAAPVLGDGGRHQRRRQARPDRRQ